MNKFMLTNILYIVVPASVGFLASFFIKIPAPILIVILYGILLFFLLPSEIYLGSSVDYQTRVSNPTYRPEKKQFQQTETKKTLQILLVVLCMVLTLLIWYFLTLKT